MPEFLALRNSVGHLSIDAQLLKEEVRLFKMAVLSTLAPIQRDEILELLGTMASPGKQERREERRAEAGEQVSSVSSSLVFLQSPIVFAQHNKLHPPFLLLC